MIFPDQLSSVGLSPLLSPATERDLPANFPITVLVLPLNPSPSPNQAEICLLYVTTVAQNHHHHHNSNPGTTAAVSIQSDQEEPDGRALLGIKIFVSARISCIHKTTISFEKQIGTVHTMTVINKYIQLRFCFKVFLQIARLRKSFCV